MTVLRTLLVTFFLTACSTKTSAPTRLQGAVVATVNREPVYESEVVVAARVHHLGARDALDRVVRDHLFVQESQRLGLTTSDDIENAVWHASIERLLAKEIEEKIRPATLSPEFLEEYFQHRRVELVHDGLVTVIHALARADSHASQTQHQQARELATRFREHVLAEGVGALVRERFEAMARQGEFSTLRCEAVPSFDRTGQSVDGSHFDEIFVRATWMLTETSPLSEVVDTPFGSHVILRVGAEPPIRRTPQEVRAILVRDGVALQRTVAMRTLLQQLHDRTETQVSETALGISPREEATVGTQAQAVH
jgi:hypothetical protein